MNLLQLGAIYSFCGLVSAYLIARRNHDAGRSKLVYVALALVVWPLWLPVVLGHGPVRSDPESNVSASEQALWQGYQAVKDTPLEKLLPIETVERIAAALRQVSERDRELSRLLSQPAFDLETVRLRISELEQRNASPRALLVAHRYRENIERLAALQARDRQLLDELGDWLATMRAQLVLARYSGSAAAGVGDVFEEICARVEVLGSTLDEPPLTSPAVLEAPWQSTFS